MRKIICSECREHLNPNEGFELPAEEKLCPQCIIKTNPGADLTKLVDSGGKQIDPVKKPIRKPREREFKIMVEVTSQRFPEEPKPVVLLTIRGEDYLTKAIKFQFATSYKTVKEWYEWMKEVDENPVTPDGAEPPLEIQE